MNHIESVHDNYVSIYLVRSKFSTKFRKFRRSFENLILGLGTGLSFPWNVRVRREEGGKRRSSNHLWSTGDTRALRFHEEGITEYRDIKMIIIRSSLKRKVIFVRLVETRGQFPNIRTTTTPLAIITFYGPDCPLSFEGSSRYGRRQSHRKGL